MFGFGRQVKDTVARAPPSCEAANLADLPKLLEKEPQVLLYGDIEEQKKLVLGITGGSDLLVAMVDCGDLQEGHRQIAVNGRLGDIGYENVAGLGFVPDLIVAKCENLKEAKALVDWTILGSQLICMIASSSSNHKQWNTMDDFRLQVFCGSGEAFVVNRLTSSRQLPS